LLEDIEGGGKMLEDKVSDDDSSKEILENNVLDNSES
jgi:hypothetical protein